MSFVKTWMGSRAPEAQTRSLSVAWTVEQRQLGRRKRRQLRGQHHGCLGMEASPYSSSPLLGMQGKFYKVSYWIAFLITPGWLPDAIRANGCVLTFPTDDCIPPSGTFFRPRSLS